MVLGDHKGPVQMSFRVTLFDSKPVVYAGTPMIKAAAIDSHLHVARADLA